jgi:hypothetical protein
MRCNLAIVALTGLGLALQGCANAADQPSYLGLAPSAAADEPDVPPAQSSPPATRHVSSNKVLGAMAFQKVTGQAIDPARLSGSR